MEESSDAPSKRHRHRFFRIDSLSDSTSASSSSSSSEDETVQEAVKKHRLFRQQNRRRKLSEDESSKKRIVRSEKDKRFGEMQASVKIMSNAMKIGDFGRLLEGYESLTRIFAKSQKVIIAAAEDGTPKFFIAALVQLQDYIDDCWEKDEGGFRKSLDKTASKNLSILRQRVRKYNRQFEKEVASYRQDPSQFLSSESEVDAKLDGGEEPMDAEEEEEEEEEEESASGSIIDAFSELSGRSDDGDEEEEDFMDLDSINVDDMWKLFLKDDTTKSESAHIVPKQRKRERRARKRAATASAATEGAAAGVEGWEERGKRETHRMFTTTSKDGGEMDADCVMEAISNIRMMRAKRGGAGAGAHDIISERCELLLELKGVVEERGLGVDLVLKIMSELISQRLDDSSRNMEVHLEKLLSTHFDEFFSLIVRPDMEEVLRRSSIRGLSMAWIAEFIVIMMELVSGLYRRLLQNTDPLSVKYASRLSYQSRIRSLFERCCTFLDEKREFTASEAKMNEYLARLYTLLYEIEHVFVRKDGSDEEERRSNKHRLNHILEHTTADPLRKLKVLLFEAFRLANHSRYYESRNILLSAFVQERVHGAADVPLQILYNRAYALHALCAFKRGLVRQAYSALADLFAANRAKELLGQGIPATRNYEKTVEQEKLEKSRLLPYHLHLNLELLETVYLTSAVLTEVSCMCAPDYDPRKRITAVNKQFFHQMRQFERFPLQLPPDSPKEHVFSAIRAMKRADWKQACRLLVHNELMSGERVWSNSAVADGSSKDAIQQLVRNLIKRECLKIFLFSYSSAYKTISFHTLANMFQLDDHSVKTIISQLIFKNELSASLDQQTQSIVMLTLDPSPFQSTALSICEKMTQFTEIGEKMAAAAATTTNTSSISRTATSNLMMRA